MFKAYLLIFNNAGLDRQKVLDFLDTRPEVKNWFAFMPNAIVIISDQNASALQAMFTAGFEGKYHFITEIVKGNNDGWLGKNVWDFINNPKKVGQ